MFMRTCPDLGFGMGRFSSLRASGPPGAWRTAARIVEGIALVRDLKRAWKIECDRMKKLIRRLGMRISTCYDFRELLEVGDHKKSDKYW
jgi:hypothetical protein